MYGNLAHHVEALQVFTALNSLKGTKTQQGTGFSRAANVQNQSGFQLSCGCLGLRCLDPRSFVSIRGKGCLSVRFLKRSFD
jgi:hypothetical protein